MMTEEEKVAINLYHIAKAYRAYGRWTEALIQYHQFISKLASFDNIVGEQPVLIPALILRNSIESLVHKVGCKGATILYARAIDDVVLNATFLNNLRHPDIVFSILDSFCVNLTAEFQDLDIQIYSQILVYIEEEPMSSYHSETVCCNRMSHEDLSRLKESHYSTVLFKRLSHTMAILLLHQGKGESALMTLNKLLSFQQENIEYLTMQEHLDIATTLRNIGLVNNLMGHSSAAVEALEDSVLIQIEELGPNHIEVANILIPIAQIHYDQGQLSLALEAYKEILSVLRNQATSNQRTHDQIYLIILCIAGIYEKLNATEKAIKYYKRLLEHNDKFITRDTVINRIKLLLHLGKVYQHSGRTHNALSSYVEASTNCVNILRIARHDSAYDIIIEEAKSYLYVSIIQSAEICLELSCLYARQCAPAA